MKLSPRRTAPWSIIEKLPNMVNFQIKCSSDEKVAHYNRVSPVKCLQNSRSQVADNVRNQVELYGEGD